MDEAASLRAVRGSLWDVLHQYNHYENTPPLYYVFLHRWISILGDSSDAMLRVPSVLFGVATVALVSWVAAQLSAKRPAATALVASGVFALCTMQVAYAQEVRAYTLWTMLAAGSTGLLLRAVRSNQRRWWMGYTLSAVAMSYTHFGSLGVLLAQVGFIAADWRSFSHAFRRRSLITMAVICPALIPLLPGILKTRSRMQGGESRTAIAVLDHAKETYVQLAGGPWLLAAILPAIGIVLVRRSTPTPQIVLVVGLGVVPVAVPLAAWWTGGAQYFPRHALPAGIGLAVAAGLGVTALNRPWRVPAVVGILSLATFSHLAQRGQLRKPALRDTAALVSAEAKPGETVVVSLLMSGWSFDRYIHRTDLRRRNYDEFTVRQVASSGEGIDRVWLVLCPPPSDESLIFEGSPLKQVNRTEFFGVSVIEMSRVKAEDAGSASP